MIKRPSNDRRLRCWMTALLGVMLLALSPPAAQAVEWDQNILKIGVLEEPKSLNLWLAGDAWSNHVLQLFYQQLYVNRPGDLKKVPWLATGDPQYDPQTLSYTVDLRPARWSDGSPFTAHDVVFTGQLIQKFKVPRFYSLWSFVKSIEAVGDHQVRFVLNRPDASFTARTLATPLVQKTQWEPIVKQCLATKKPLASLLRVSLDHPASSGPFVLKSWRRGVFLHLERNPHFFGQGLSLDGRPLGPHIEGIVFKVYGTSDAAILALRKGSIDFYWNNVQPGYLRDIAGDPAIQVFRNQKSALYFMGFNLRRPPFDDLALRRAVAMLVDKRFIVTRVLQNAGEVMSALVPAGNAFYHLDQVAPYDQELTRGQRVQKAYEILTEAGYTWKTRPMDHAGRVQTCSCLLRPDGSEVPPLTILTPPADYDPQRAMSGMMIQEWLGQVGIMAAARPMAFGAMLEKVKGHHDYDAFVLGYGNLSLDPAWVSAFFVSKNAGKSGWNMSGYHDPQFDALAEKAAKTLDPEQRRDLVLQMQRMVQRDVPFLPLYNPLLVEAARNDRFQGWVPMVGGIGNLWSLCQLRPSGAPAAEVR
ncbi:MAG: ABC transporter substrate-binding protein [Desulfarculus sp.]|nr:ABC transporter substrate-binding protein [Desulfarculus sp.]